MGPVTLTYQRTARVALRVLKGGGINEVLSFSPSLDNKTASLTNLAGVDASIDVACAEHAVIQRVPVNVGGFAFVLGDEEDASIHQLVRTVVLWDKTQEVSPDTFLISILGMHIIIIGINITNILYYNAA